MKILKKDIKLFGVEDNCPANVMIAREQAGQTQLEAAAEIHFTHRNTWGRKESGERAMTAAEFELYLLKIDRHKDFKLVRK